MECKLVPAPSGPWKPIHMARSLALECTFESGGATQLPSIKRETSRPKDEAHPHSCFVLHKCGHRCVSLSTCGHQRVIYCFESQMFEAQNQAFSISLISVFLLVHKYLSVFKINTFISQPQQHLRQRCISLFSTIELKGFSSIFKFIYISSVCVLFFFRTHFKLCHPSSTFRDASNGVRIFLCLI